MKRRHLRQRRSVLVVVEGDTEFAFCRYLKATLCRGCDIHVTIVNAHGGSPDQIVDFARRRAAGIAHDAIAIMLDGDKPLRPTSRQKAVRLRAQLILLTPCIEGFLLKLMGCKAPADSAACKRDFHEHGLGEKEKLEHDAYRDIFPVEKMESLMADEQFALLWGLFRNRDPSC